MSAENVARITLTEPEGWEAREGYLATLRMQHNAHQSSTLHFRREDVQAFVQQAAERFGIVARAGDGAA